MYTSEKKGKEKFTEKSKEKRYTVQGTVLKKK